jgi:Cu-Zn family superoxide dismutase
MIRPAAVLSLALLPACGGQQSQSQAATVAPARSAEMIDSAGKGIGRASLLQSREGALLVLKLQRIPPGTHGLHVHDTGTCTPPGFESAGPHLNPAKKKHGSRNPAGSHAGDLPNVHADAKGVIDTTLTLSRDLLTPALLGAEGAPRALVLHAKADDLMTDPSGNSGDRIACGVLGK